MPSPITVDTTWADPFLAGPQTLPTTPAPTTPEAPPTPDAPPHETPFTPSPDTNPSICPVPNPNEPFPQCEMNSSN
jgi:hypothetical protein